MVVFLQILRGKNAEDFLDRGFTAGDFQQGGLADSQDFVAVCLFAEATDRLGLCDQFAQSRCNGQDFENASALGISGAMTMITAASRVE